ncbi:MAG: FadR family transcriptional regulator [Vicinamibacteria bacterium]|jgi:GntR family transcriptional repressor for pyruvate dehydrogenase complex|nr:FadR family transcriptional regulator [Vicinamibacteria bacterium]
MPTSSKSAAGLVVAHVRQLIEAGQLRPGDRLPPERDLAQAIGVSRPTLRSGLRTLQAMGAIEARQGAGTFVAAGPPRLGGGPLRFLAALHGFTRDEMFEARQVLEVGSARLAAQRATAEQAAALADAVAGMFSALDDPHQFLVHDVQFHRSVAAASGNPVLATLIDTVSELVYETRRLTVERAHDLKESAAMHRRIYRAIRERKPDVAAHEMWEHLDQARRAQAIEDEPADAGPAQPGAGR